MALLFKLESSFAETQKLAKTTPDKDFFSDAGHGWISATMFCTSRKRYVTRIYRRFGRA